MGWRKYLRKEYACMKDDHGVTLDFVKLDRTKEIFSYGSGEDKKSYNIKRDEMYDLKLVGFIFTKVIYFYNVNNPMPLNFSKTSNAFEPIISPRLYNRMLENEILIKLNTLSSNWDWKKILIIVGVLALAYLAWQSGIFSPHTAALNVTNVTNATNTTDVTGNFTKIAVNASEYVRNVNPINISAMRNVTI